MNARRVRDARRRYFLGCALTTAVFAALSRPAPAQDRTGTAPPGALTMHDAIVMALEREPGLRAETTAIEVAKGDLSQAALRPNPMVSFGQLQQPGGSDNQTMINVEMPLDLFRAPARVAVAARNLEATESRVADRGRVLAAEVRAAYGAAAAAARNLEILDQITEAAARQFEVVRGRVEAGAAPPLERDLLAVERHRIDAERMIERAAVDAALLELKRLLGLDPAEPLALGETLEGLAAEPGGGNTPSPLDDTALQRRPDVREAEAQVSLAEAKTELARREGRLDMAIFGAYTRMQTSFPQRGFTADGALQPVGAAFHYFSAGARFTLPLRNDNRGSVAAARAQESAAAAWRRATELRARTEVATAAIQDTRSRAAGEIYAREVRPLARQNLDVVTQAYELGRGTVADVLAEQRRYLDIERAYTDVLKHAFDARTSLLTALGVQP